MVVAPGFWSLRRSGFYCNVSSPTWTNDTFAGNTPEQYVCDSDCTVTSDAGYCAAPTPRAAVGAERPAADLGDSSADRRGNCRGRRERGHRRHSVPVGGPAVRLRAHH